MSISPDLARGTELAGYRIDALLGRGGMGVVYLAEDLRLKRRVALKLLAPRLAEDESFREGFLAESELAASLDHPNIVPIYEAGEADGRLFIAMRYVEGSDLKQLLRDGPLESERALALVAQVGTALDAAHGRGLVHGDVKPSNVLIAPGAGPGGSDHAYLADFGLTRRIAGPSAAVREGGLAATIDYVAPEQIRGDDVDGRADVYSLGCLLYECLTGGPPFPRASEAAVLFAHLEDDPLAPPGLEEVIPQALAKSPEERYGSCRELVEAARASLGIATPARPRWSRAPVLLALAGTTLLAVGVASYLVVRGGGAPAAPAGGSLVRIDPGTNKAVTTAPVGKNPAGIAVGAGRVWVATAGDSSVWAIDPSTRETLRIPAGGTPIGIAVSGGTVYVADGTVVGTNVTTIDEASGARGAVIDVGGLSAIASGGQGVWIGAGDVARLSTPRSTAPSIGQRIAIPSPSPLDASHYRFRLQTLAVGKGEVWALGDARDPRLFRIDLHAGRVIAAIQLPFAPLGLALGTGAVWVTAQLDDAVARVDPATNRIVATIKVGREPSSVAVGAGALWVANTIDRTVTRIDPRTNRVTATIPVRSSPQAVLVGRGSVWVAGDAV
jgi:YVTN family beta-propeller protein